MRKLTGRMSVAVLTGALVLAAAGSASASDYFASPAGSGTSCTEVTPCSLTQASTSAGSGDTVRLLPGTYDMGASSTTTGTGETWLGNVSDPESTVMTSTSSAWTLMVSGAGSKASGFKVENTATSTYALALSTGTLADGMIGSSPGSGSSGCFINNATMRNTLCVASSSGLYSNPLASGTSTLRNVTAVGGSIGIAANCLPGLNSVLDAKSTIASGGSIDLNLTTLDLASTLTANFTHSNFSTINVSGPGTETPTPPSTASNQTAEPIFVDSGAGDYRQAAGSPTINAGTVDGNSGSLDLDGATRVQGAAADIGAYEFFEPPQAQPQPAPTPTPTADTTKPTIRVTSKPKRRSTKRTAVFKFSASETATFRCKLDRGKFRACKSPYRARVKPGKHTLTIVATDVAGNVSLPTKVSWKTLAR